MCVCLYAIDMSIHAIIYIYKMNTVSIRSYIYMNMRVYIIYVYFSYLPEKLHSSMKYINIS